MTGHGRPPGLRRGGERAKPLGVQAGEGAAHSTACPAQTPCCCPTPLGRVSSSAQLLAHPGTAKSGRRPQPSHAGQVSMNLEMFSCVAEGWEGLERCWGQAGEGCPRPQRAPDAGPHAQPCPLPLLPRCEAAGQPRGRPVRRVRGALLLPSPCR